MKPIYFASLALPLAACGTTPVSADLVGMEFEPEVTADPVPVGEPIAEPEVEVPVEPEIAPEVSADLRGCEAPTQHWFNEQINWWIDTGWLGIVGDNQFVVHSQQINNSETLLRVSDGAVAGSLLTPVAIEYDDSQTRGIYWTETAFEVRDVESQRVLSTIELEGGHWQTYRMELSPDGRTVASARCSDDGQHLEIRAFDLAFGAEQSWSVPTEGMVYCPGWASHNAIPFDVAADTVITAEPGTGGVLLLSTTDGSTRTVQAHDAGLEEDRFWYDQPVLDVAVHPDGTEFATSGLDGQVRRWRLSDLSLIDERDSSWIVVNTQTYTTPFAVSPIVYGYGGLSLAYTTADEAAGIVNLATGTTDLVVPVASGERPDHMGDQYPNWGIAELGFAPDDRSLIVVESGGTQLFGCEIQVETTSETLDVDVDMPLTTGVGDAWTFDIQVNSSSALVGGQWSLNGVQLAPLHHLNSWSWTFHEPGAQAFRLVLDDGRNVFDQVFEIQVVR